MCEEGPRGLGWDPGGQGWCWGRERGAGTGREGTGKVLGGGVVLNPSLADFFRTNTISHQCPYTEHAHFNQIEYAMNC